MDAGDAIGLVMAAAVMAFASGGGAIWLQRYSRQNFAGRESPLPQAKIYDGRGFGRAPVEGRNRPALVVVSFYIAMLWALAALSVIGGAGALAITLLAPSWL